MQGSGEWFELGFSDVECNARNVPLWMNFPNELNTQLASRTKMSGTSLLIEIYAGATVFALGRT